MCILFIAKDRHPDYSLIIAANRDEYYARPSQSMNYWPDKPSILAGRDLEAGGTWLGVNRTGRFAAVTNFRDPGNHREEAKSRGDLVTRYLDQEFSARQNCNFEQYLKNNHLHYNPFNFIYGDHQQLRIWGHQSDSSRLLTPGFHSISNGTIDQWWPKMSRGVERLSDYISGSENIEFRMLLNIMQDTTRWNIDELPETGIDPTLEQELSSIFVHGDHYGTRTTTLLLLSSSQMKIAEYNYSADGAVEPGRFFSTDTIGS